MRNPIAKHSWKFNKPKIVKSKKLYSRKKKHKKMRLVINVPENEVLQSMFSEVLDSYKEFLLDDSYGIKDKDTYMRSIFNIEQLHKKYFECLG